MTTTLWLTTAYHHDREKEGSNPEHYSQDSVGKGVLGIRHHPAEETAF